MTIKLKNCIITYIQNHKKKTIFWIILTLIAFVSYIFISNNYSYYTSPIATINNIKTTTDTNSDGDRIIIQHINATIRNGNDKGLPVSLENIYEPSNVYTDKYVTGNDVFISYELSENTSDSNTDTAFTATITGLKRDKYVSLLIIILVYILIILCNKKGLMTIISMIINLAIFYYAIDMYSKGHNILCLSIISAVLFAILSLIIISGFNKKTLAAVLSTLITVAIITLLSFILVSNNSDIDYSFMEFLYFSYERYDANMLFIAEILLCGLGAIMDISITMSSTVNELVDKNHNITSDSLFKSCREIGHDVMGTMVNVMFFTNLGGCIPFIILSMKNSVPLPSLIKYNMFFELARFLTGSIGILLTIPVATYISVYIFKHNQEARQ